MQLEEAFDAWFEGSKAVNNQGEPLVLYHGCPRREAWKPVTYLSSSRWVAEDFAEQLPNTKGSVYPVRLQMRNPLDAREYDGAKELIRLARTIPGIDVVSDIERTREGWEFECQDLALRYDADPTEPTGLLLIPEMRSILADQGYDGVVLADCYENTLVDTWVPLETRQILIDGDEPPLPGKRPEQGDSFSP